MTAPTDIRRLLVDAVPAVLLTVAVSIVMALRVDELDGKRGVLIVAGVAHLLFKGIRGGDWIGMLLMVGLIAAGLLAATVSGILRLARARAARGGAA